MKTIISISTAIIFALFLSQAVQANPEKKERVISKVTKKLSLDTTQQDLLRLYINEKFALKKKFQAKRKERKNNANYQDEFSILSSENYLTIEQINTMMETRFANRKAERQASIAAFVDFRNSLSVEQRATGKKTLKRLFKMKKKGRKGKHLKNENAVSQ